MTKLATVARSRVRNAVLCTLVTLTLAACGSDDASNGAASTASVATSTVGTISRSDGAGSATSPAASTGGNPSSGSSSAPPAASSSAATVDWTPPTENSDGSALTNLAGYKLYYGTSPDSLTHTVKVANPGLTAFTVTDLTSGTWYFSVSAYSASGVESARTGTVTTTL